MRRRGLTLVELLIVIAVIAMLFAILLPAVLQARSGSRKSACSNNLRQLASAVQQFHQRTGSLPVYWGSMDPGTSLEFVSGASGEEPFGGWAYHLLPDLGQQTAFDGIRLPPRGGPPRGYWRNGVMIDPGYPASDDYSPGEWVTTVTSVEEVNHVGVTIIIQVTKSELVGQRGTPGRGPTYEQIWVPTGGVWAEGIATTFGIDQEKIVLDVLQCGDDVSQAGPGSKVRCAELNANASLTNYLANAHVFMKFSSGRRISAASRDQITWGDMGGRYAPAWIPACPTSGGFGGCWYSNEVAKAAGPPPRKFDHVTDGLTNTILFGEAMRQCDNGAANRFAFLPSFSPGDEHTFGIEPSFYNSAGTSVIWWGGYGNTLMFQARPNIRGCNKLRLQANHDQVLMAAMCDGSVRGISATVSRREQVDPDVAGRSSAPGNKTYTPTGLGAVGTAPWGPSAVKDGIWDMLMVPTDPANNVLSNTGEVGHEK